MPRRRDGAQRTDAPRSSGVRGIVVVRGVGLAALAAELALHRSGPLGAVGRTLAVEVGLALASICGLLLALQCLTELALGLFSCAEGVLFVGTHGTSLPRGTPAPPHPGSDRPLC